MLDKLFLLRFLARLPAAVANLLTFLVVMVGWTIFRASSLGQAGEFLTAMVSPGVPATKFVLITPDVTAIAVIAAFVCALPRLPGFDRARAWLLHDDRRGVAVQAALSLLFVVAVGKATAEPFSPFLYFRF